MQKRLATTLTIVGVAAALACNNSLAPFQPEITNAPNTFQLQATGLQNVTTTLDYVWQNDGTVANVNQATVLPAGSATITISDANHVAVYHNDLTVNGTMVTSAGSPGNWIIHVALSNASGTLNVRAQKP